MRLQLDTQVSHTASTAALPTSSPAAGADKTSGSQDSVKVSTLSTALSRMAADRADRLQQIAGSLGNGSYGVSGSAIAGAITGHALTAE
jgi:anti-sigma28 factor (negative regulator of flagellin synthesis)